MYSTTDSPVTVPQRPLLQVMYPPTVLNEYIKCVVIGDSGVGKTHLITAWACDANYSLDKLVKTHVSTVWAHDHYRNDKNILERSVVEIDGGYVALRLWDTFGYHDKDRGFAYRGADVVLLCFNVGMPRSLHNIRKVWIPEIRRKAPTTPVVVVGCQADLRFLYLDEAYQKIHKGLMYRVVQEKDIVTPEQGRAVAKEISAPYYECSVFTKYGIDDVFSNVIRAAMVERRKLRFWSSMLRRMQYPQIQPPMKMPPLVLPKIEVPDPKLHDDLCRLLHNQSEGDVIFVVQGRCFRAHKICLVISASVFQLLFLKSEVDSTRSDRSLSQKSSFSSLGSASAHSGVINPVLTDDGDMMPLCASDNVNQNANVHNAKYTNFIANNKAFLSVEENKSCDNPFRPGEVTYQTIVTLNHDITPRAFQLILEYLYTGILKEDIGVFTEAKLACQLLQLTNLAVRISNVESGEQYLNVELDHQFREDRQRNLKEIALHQEKLADIKFRVDDGIVAAHKPLLVARCEMMYAMFNDNFIEASADMISLPGMSRETFLALREFLYTGECPAGATINCLSIIEVANRLCLPRLVRLVEARVVEDLTNEDRDGEDILEDVLMLLEPAQLHNADLLTEWCRRFLCNHFLSVKQKYSKAFHKLSPDNIRYIEKNRWPPEWYIRELNFYEHMKIQAARSKKSHGNIQQKQQFSRWEQCTNAAGCLCFCRRSRSRIVKDETVTNELPD